MKKFSLTSIIILVIVVFCSCSGANSKDGVKEDIPINFDFAKENYEEIKSNAKIIAKVEVLDDLSEESGIVEKSNGFIVSFVSKRSVKVLEYYKNVTNQQDTEMTILENAAIIDEQYLHPDGCNTLEKGKTYILFLSDETASGIFGIMNGPDGIIDISEIDQSGNAEITIKSLIEFESTLDNTQKEQLLNADVQLEENIVKPQHEEYIDIERSKGTLKLKISYKQVNPNCFAVEIMQ